MIVHFRDVLRSSAAPEPRRESVNDRLRRRIREQNWAARCKPTEFKDTNGVVHLKYAAQGCDRGPDPDIDAVKADDSTVAVKP
jgi:hypothetical protein